MKLWLLLLACSFAKAQDCGIAVPSRKRIVNGREVGRYRYPWIGLFKRDSDSRPFCAGTLVSPYFVVTAAHCLRDRSVDDITVTFGVYNWCSNNEDTRKNYRIKQIFVPDNTGGPDFEDITMVQLADPADIAPACLPESAGVPPQTAFVIGWGRHGLHSDKSRCKQKEGITAVLSKELCNQMGVPERFSDDPKLICGGGGSVYPCHGDSGGPFVTKTEDGRYVLAGVVSWGFGCEVERKPAIYSNVGWYLDWIKQIIANYPRADSEFPDALNTDPPYGSFYNKNEGASPSDKGASSYSTFSELYQLAKRLIE